MKKEYSAVVACSQLQICLWPAIVYLSLSLSLSLPQSKMEWPNLVWLLLPTTNKLHAYSCAKSNTGICWLGSKARLLPPLLIFLVQLDQTRRQAVVSSQSPSPNFHPSIFFFFLFFFLLSVMPISRGGGLNTDSLSHNLKSQLLLNAIYSSDEEEE